MPDSEIQPLNGLSVVTGLVDRWKSDEEALLRRHEAELEELRNGRKTQETLLSVGVLEKVCQMCREGLNEKAKRLEDQFNGFSITDDNFWETIDRQRENPLVTIVPYFQVAKALGSNRAGEFLRSLMVEFQRRKHGIPKDKIRLIGVSSSGDNKRFGGIVLLCDNNRGMGNYHFGVGFDVFYNSEGKIPEVRVRDANFLDDDLRDRPVPGSLNYLFDQMLLSEQVSVIAGLFIATNQAVDQALLAREIPAK